MSFGAVQYVHAHSPARGTEKLILSILAEHANDKGECWPSVGLLAAKANCSDRHVRNALNALVERGELERDINGGRGTRSDLRPNRYRIVMPVCMCPRGGGGYIAHVPGPVGEGSA